MIRWDIISEAIQFYQRLDFQYIEVPWTAGPEAMAITSPPGAAEYWLEPGQLLVASAEQSLLQMAREGKLKPEGRYIACTPCFRGDKIDEIHHRYFMKVELMVYQPTLPDLSALAMLGAALNFFKGYITCHPLKLPDGSVDIQTTSGIELGSYGIRHHDSVGTWVFGTGVAEPRLSYAMRSSQKFFAPTK
jgi:hypothetical protein